MSELFTVENLSKQFNHRPVLENVAFSVRTGEVLGLIGPNGSGKTTLLECLAGLIPANGGSLKNHGKDLLPSKRNEALFYLPDSIAPWSQQPVKWILKLFSKLYATQDRVGDLVQSLRLEDFMNSAVGTLSKG